VELLAVLALRRPHHWEFVVSGALGLGTCLGILVTSIAERSGKVKAVEELNTPLTLFPRSTR
jgi:hypothetical protein